MSTLPMDSIPADDIDSDFDELDSLLASAVKQSEMLRNQKALEKAQRDKNLTAEARQRAAEEAERIAALLRWKSISNVALFFVSTCTHCGEQHQVFANYLLYQESKASKHERRWVAITQPEPNLQKEVAFQYREVPMCMICANEFGWDFSHVNNYTIPQVPNAQTQKPDSQDAGGDSTPL